MSDVRGSDPVSSRDSGPSFLVRWRGQTFGPLSLGDIQRKLESREISLVHEVLCDGRWISVRELQSNFSGADFTAPRAPAGARQGSRASVPGGHSSGEEYQLRWKGNTFGPVNIAEIERKLDRQEIGMLHEIHFEGQWVSLNEFFVGRNQAVASARTFSAARPKVRGQGSKLGARIVLDRVTRQLKNGTKILDDINLVIEPNEFVALLGPSGSGKSTLMNAMTGRQRASHGTITLNGEDFYANAAEYRHKIGHVPQKDIVHLTLTVEQTLSYSAQLRLPASVTTASIAQRVADVVEQTGLRERTKTRNSDLSGGQLKRVSLGVELLSDPELLFLDEATSGLDAGTEARMMSLFRRLADDGRTVVCITHNLENVSLCDLVAVLSEGRLVYYGPTAELAAYLGVQKISQIYDRLGDKTPMEWALLYAASEYHQTYVAGRKSQRVQRPMASEPTVSVATAGGWRQFLILTRRYLAVMLQDRRNVLLLLIQAPIIAVLLGAVFRGKSFEPDQVSDIRKTLSFLMVVSAIWFGCINSAREIVKELAIYLRERAVGLNMGSYLASKILVLSCFCAVQCATLFGITLQLTSFRPDLGMQSSALLLTSLVGMLMGLLISALVKTEDKAMAVIPILLIPQVIFSGAILDLSKVAEAIGKWLIVAFWSYDAMLHALGHGDKVAPKFFASFGEDMVTMGLFVVVLTFLTAFSLKGKDVAK